MKPPVRFPGLPDQRIHDRLLVTRDEIDDFARDLRTAVVGADLIFLDEPQGSRLETAEAEVETPVADLGDRKVKCTCIPISGNPVDNRTARVTEPEEFGELIERLPRGIITGAGDKAWIREVWPPETTRARMG